MSWLIGRTGHSFFDYWTLSHFAFWFVVGSSTGTLKKRGFVVLVGLCIAFWWEVFEKFAEKKWPAVWLTPESWLNSWVSDPLMCVLGLLIAWWGFDHWRPL